MTPKLSASKSHEFLSSLSKTSRKRSTEQVSLHARSSSESKRPAFASLSRKALIFKQARSIPLPTDGIVRPSTALPSVGARQPLHRSSISSVFHPMAQPRPATADPSATGGQLFLSTPLTPLPPRLRRPDSSEETPRLELQASPPRTSSLPRRGDKRPLTAPTRY
jgi:hypothetical protein